MQDNANIQELRPTGTSRSERVEVGPPLLAANVPDGVDLAGLAMDYFIFNHGLLHTMGGLSTDVIYDFVSRHPDSHCEVRVLAWPTRLFSGIDVKPYPTDLRQRWDHRLLLCPWEYAVALHRHLRTTACMDLATGAMTLTSPQQLQIRDKRVTSRSIYGAQTVPVYGYGLVGNRGQAYFQPRRHPDGPDYMVVRAAPSAEVTLIASSFHNGASNPFDAVEAPLKAPWLADAVAANDRMAALLADKARLAAMLSKWRPLGT